MNKQCLSIEQMQHLKELGVDTSKASMCWIIDEENKHKPFVLLSIDASDHVDITTYSLPTFTLQDVLDALPNRIYDKGEFYFGCYDIMIDEHDICYAKWCGSEIESTYVEIEIKDNLIDAAYKMLCWCIENGYVETKKQD